MRLDVELGQVALEALRPEAGPQAQDRDAVGRLADQQHAGVGQRWDALGEDGGGRGGLVVLRVEGVQEAPDVRGVLRAGQALRAHPQKLVGMIDGLSAS